MKLETYIVNAFADAPGCGNRAGVVVSQQHPPEDAMRFIAADIGASETAFVAPRGKTWSIRWFSLLKEMPLCGHATLAASQVLFQKDSRAAALSFEYTGGTFQVIRRADGTIGMEFPLDDYRQCPMDPVYREFFGNIPFVECIQGVKTKKVVLITCAETDLKLLRPDFNRMAEHHGLYSSGIAITRSSFVYDFETRYFNPWAGVNEDPVTGSVHTLLARYWSSKLDKKKLVAYQNSQRPGELLLTVEEETVEIRGRARIVLRGIFLL